MIASGSVSTFCSKITLHRRLFHRHIKTHEMRHLIAPSSMLEVEATSIHSSSQKGCILSIQRLSHSRRDTPSLGGSGSCTQVPRVSRSGASLSFRHSIQTSAMGRVSRAPYELSGARNCTRDEGGPFEFGDQEPISSHRKLLRAKAVVVSVAETPRPDFGRHGRERRAQANRCRSVESGLGDVRTGG